MYRRGIATAAGLSVSLVALGAAAQDVCVECKEPGKSYRCTIKDSSKVQHIRGVGRAVEFVCLNEIARVGGHQSCRVSTAYTGPCIGQHHEVDLAKAGAEGAASAKAEPEAAGSGPVPEPAQVAVQKGPPQTLEELARDTVTKSKEQFSAADEKMRKAGDAVGGSLKKTWDCLSTLFNRC